MDCTFFYDKTLHWWNAATRVTSCPAIAYSYQKSRQKTLPGIFGNHHFRELAVPTDYEIK